MATRWGHLGFERLSGAGFPVGDSEVVPRCGRMPRALAEVGPPQPSPALGASNLHSQPPQLSRLPLHPSVGAAPPPAVPRAVSPGRLLADGVFRDSPCVPRERRGGASRPAGDLEFLSLTVSPASSGSRGDKATSQSLSPAGRGHARTGSPTQRAEGFLLGCRWAGPSSCLTPRPRAAWSQAGGLWPRRRSGKVTPGDPAGPGPRRSGRPGTRLGTWILGSDRPDWKSCL